MPEGRYSDVELDITAKDFIATVAVTGSQTESGTEGTESGIFTIFDLTGQKLGQHSAASAGVESEVSVLLDYAIIEAEDIAGLSVERLAATRQYVTVADTNQVTQKGKETVVQFKVAAHVPVERIEFVVGADPANFSRDVTVKTQPVVAARRRMRNRWGR